MRFVLRTSAVLVLVALLAAPAVTQTQPQPTRQQLNQNAMQALKKCDQLRAQGDFKEAMKGYQFAGGIFQNLNMGRWLEVSHEMFELCSAMPLTGKKLKDGVFTGTAKGYVDAIIMEVTIDKGKIAAVRVAQQKESRPGDVFTTMPQTIVTAQSPSVDTITGATITSYAVMSATRRAIAQAQTANATPAAKKP